MRIGATRCAVETAAVVGVLGADASLLAVAPPSPLVVGLKRHAGALVPIVDLRRWPGFAAGEGSLSARPRWVLLRGEAGAFGVTADEVAGVFEASISQELPVTSTAPGALIRGGISRGRDVVLELDVRAIASALATYEGLA